MSNSGEPSRDFIGVGWSFPPSFGRGGAEVEMVSDEDDIHQSIEILLGTVQGERVMQETFGCELSSLLFEEANRWIMTRLEQTVRDAILTHEPRVSLERVEVDASDAQSGALEVKIVYSIRNTNSRFNMVFPFYLMEATQAQP